MDFMTVTERKLQKLLDKLAKRKLSKDLGSFLPRANVFRKAQDIDYELEISKSSWQNIIN